MSKEVLNTITVHGKTYKLPQKPMWHKGPPPEIGWWPASIVFDVEILRWWNGRYWSEFSKPHTPLRFVSEPAAFKASNQSIIEWTAQWWKGQQ